MVVKVVSRQAVPDFFNADFSAWEEKEDYVNFRFIKAEDDALHFAGISFYKVSDDELNAYLAPPGGSRSGGAACSPSRTGSCSWRRWSPAC